MKQKLILIIVVLFLASCSSKPAGDELTKEQQLQAFRKEYNELKQKINALEEELAANEEKEVVNVNVTKLENQLFEHFFEVTGNVEAELDVNVSPESAGIIEEVLVTEGMNVNKGDVLGKLNTSALQRSLDEILIQQELANTTFERQKNLWEQNIGSEIEFLQAKTSKEAIEKRVEAMKAQIEMAVIKSPIDGVIDIVYQKKGQIGSPQVPFAKVLNMSKVKIYADVAETYLTKIKKGDKVTVEFPALATEIKTPIYRIGNTIDPNNRTFRVRLNLDNSNQMIKPNIMSIIKIRDYVSKEAIVVPSLIIKEDFRGDYTYIVDSSNGENKAKKVYVTLGVSDNNMTEVLEGLTADMQVITDGFTQIVDGTFINF